MFYITKYALKKGILAVTADNDEDRLRIEMCYEKHCFTNREDAVEKANEMRNEKIAKLRQQISELQEMSFD